MVILLKNGDVHVHFRRERSFLVLAMISKTKVVCVSNRLSATIVYCCLAWEVEVIMHVEGCVVSSSVSVVCMESELFCELLNILVLLSMANMVCGRLLSEQC